MPQIIILVSLAVVVGSYVYLSRREGSYVNILTPVLLFGIPAWYLLMLVYGGLFGYDASTYAYFYCYLTYALGVIGTMAGYLLMPAKPLPIFVRLPYLRLPGIPFLALAVAILLYAPILIRFPDLLFSPRQIYELTRSGFGISFYLSALAVYVGLILLLFLRRVSRSALVLFVIVSMPIIYLHGSKGQVLNFALIVLYFLVFVKGKRFNMMRLIGVGTVVSSLIVGLFYLSYSDEARADLLVEMANYAEYTRNAAMVIDDPTLEPQMGRLAFESKFYVMVPRAIFPDKPKDYGAFWLAKRYSPDRFDLDVGAPDFGLGFLYADFGDFAAVYYFAGSVLAGIIMKILVARLRHRPDAGTFFILLAFLDVGLIPTGAGGVPLIVYYLLAYAVRGLGTPPWPAGDTTQSIRTSPRGLGTA
jgi:hypothetical protein